ncbi:hypothetical protein AB0J82_06185 [Asanoa sp. NPDC049518]|uniref:hypothetical protein n=1 Tax=unclassified Asanoa TaxID=2685164 RepID=UPI003437F851
MADTIQCPTCKALMTDRADGFYVDAHGTLIYTNTYYCQRCGRLETIETGPKDTRAAAPPANTFTNAADALIERSNNASCELCIDGHMPAGIAHLFIGPVYIACTACGTECPACGGDAMFPANWRCLHCFIEAMLANGFDPIFCSGCGGVTAVVPIRQEPSDF